MSGPVGVLLDLLFPPKCVFCGRLLTSGERDFCARCQRELPWLAGPEAEQTGEFFTLCASPLAYRDQVRDSIRRYKFKGRQGYHKAYGRLVAQCVHDHLDGRWDLITWVPLSDQRRRERGYDQAFLLASAAALELGEVAVETLRKGRNTEAQSGRRRGPPGQCAGGLHRRGRRAGGGQTGAPHRRRDHHRRDYFRMCKDSAHRGGQRGGMRHLGPGERIETGKVCGN